MGNVDTKVKGSLSLIGGELPLDNLLATMKSEMVKQTVWQRMFGVNGENIFTDRMPSYNDTILPALELYWDGETFQSHDTIVSGTIQGKFLMPVMLKGDYNYFRRVAAAFARWLASRHQMFTLNPGLIEFGAGVSFRYNQIIEANGISMPIIGLTIPFKLDLTLFRQLRPEIDLTGDLDEALWPDVTSYEIKQLDDNGVEITGAGAVVRSG